MLDREHGGAVTAGAFVPNDAGWPAAFQDAYIYGKFGRIRKVSLLKRPQLYSIIQSFLTLCSSHPVLILLTYFQPTTLLAAST